MMLGKSLLDNPVYASPDSAWEQIISNIAARQTHRVSRMI
jgi:hypothetical protein